VSGRELVSAERRRELAAELVEQRSKAIAGLPLDYLMPDGASAAWALGLGVLAGRAMGAQGARRRELVIGCGAFVLGWLEALEEGERASGPGR
jgi:hypothetical protein